MKRHINTWLVLMVAHGVATCESNVWAEAWTPSSTTTLTWYDAADASTISTNDAAGYVSHWNDKSGNGYHASSAAANQPATGSTTLNGLNTLSFDGVNDVLASSSVNALPVSIFAVVNNPGEGQFVYVSRVGLGMGGTTFGDAGSNFLGIKETVVWVTTTEPVATSGTILEQVYPSNSDPTLFFQNGNPVTIAGGKNNTPSASTTPVSIGSGGARSPDVEIAEVIVVDREVPAGVRQRFEGYLAHKWGLQAQLPGGHPYKSIAPVAVWFEDPFVGSGSASAPGSLATDATTASAKVSDYIVDTASISIVDSEPQGVGNPTPSLNMPNLATAFHLNLTTVAGATYRVALQTSMWGNSQKPNPTFALDVSAFDGTDTITGTALGSDGFDVPNGFVTGMTDIVFTFVAESTATTLFFEGAMGNNDQINAWIDNLEIGQTQLPPPAGAVMVVR